MRVRRRRCRAFTMLELLVVLVLTIAITLVLIPLVRPGRVNIRSIKDAVQVRGLMQAVDVWAQNNHGNYPLPSALDRANATTAEQGRAKDHSANIWSVLIFNGLFGAELLVSPAEVNKRIAPYAGYRFTSPAAAVSPATAMWDPAFTVDFTRATGGTSYAHLQPSGARVEKRWTSNRDALRPVLGNRGPRISAVSATADDARITAAPDSLTNLIHGSRKAWEGHVAFNDHHVESMTTLTWMTCSPRPTYRTTAGTHVLDIAFFDEPDDADGTNAFLGLFTTAGDRPTAWTAIWD